MDGVRLGVVYVRDVATDRSGDGGMGNRERGRGVLFVCVCALDCVFVLVFFFSTIFFIFEF